MTCNNRFEPISFNESLSSMKISMYFLCTEIIKTQIKSNHTSTLKGIYYDDFGKFKFHDVKGQFYGQHLEQLEGPYNFYFISSDRIRWENNYMDLEIDKPARVTDLTSQNQLIETFHLYLTAAQGHSLYEDTEQAILGIILSDKTLREPYFNKFKNYIFSKPAACQIFHTAKHLHKRNESITIESLMRHADDWDQYSFEMPNKAYLELVTDEAQKMNDERKARVLHSIDYVQYLPNGNESSFYAGTPL